MQNCMVLQAYNDEQKAFRRIWKSWKTLVSREDNYITYCGEYSNNACSLIRRDPTNLILTDRLPSLAKSFTSTSMHSIAYMLSTSDWKQWISGKFVSL